MSTRLVSNQLAFADRVAVVTGAARGLGREYALLLASRGASIVGECMKCNVPTKNSWFLFQKLMILVVVVMEAERVQQRTA